MCDKHKYVINDVIFIRLDLDAKTQNYQLFNMKSVLKWSIPISTKIGEDMAEGPTRRPTQVSLPNSPPIKRYCQNTISIRTQNKYTRYATNKWCFSALNLESFDMKI